MDLNINNKLKKLIIIPVFSRNKKVNFFENEKNEKLKKSIKKILTIYNFEGKKEETLFFNIDMQKILLIGIEKEYTLEDLRKAYSVCFKIINSKKETESLIEVPKEEESEIKAIVEGLDLTNYKFDKYLKKEKKEIEPEISLNIDKKFGKILKETLLVNKNVKLSRDLVNENSSIITPKKLENIIKEFAKNHKLKTKILNEKQIKKEKLNLLLAVGKGSEHPPRLIIVEYCGNPKSKEKTALVGKGITFDTGGVNLKPTNFIEDMKTDMGGAATVFGAFKSAVELKLNKNLILVISAAENAISAGAYKPGDIFISYSGISVEIGNTDAEGRLVLADALSYVQKNFLPSKIIDMATLTGASIVALGPTLIAMLGNDNEMKKQLSKSSENTFERVWELPIYEEHREAMKSKFADILNISEGSSKSKGGTITAAAFLEKFIEKDVSWTHLDIAGAARSHLDYYYIPEFGTGRGVRLLIEYLKNS